jgi:ABC-2 type transport system permease protein
MRALTAAPTLLRVGAMETFAYRAEFLVWMLTMTLPLVMLALWSSVAAEAPFRGFSSQDFVAYYLVTLIVRQITSSWVAWQLGEEIRRGSLALRLLKPVHPFVAFGCHHLAAVPLRSAVAIPVAIALLISTGSGSLATNPMQIACALPSLALAWAITFAMQLILGCLALFFTKAASAIDVYFGLFAIFSGYTLPIALLPSWLANAAAYTPFPSALAHTVSIFTNDALGPWGALRLLSIQAGWTAAIFAAAVTIWRVGLKRFEAVGS